MTHPLDGPRLKVRRAKEEIKRLRLVQDTFQIDADYKVVRAEHNPQTGRYVYRVRIGRPIPMDWGVWVGEIAHNLRSALDGLVHQLALLNLAKGRTPASITQFPIFLIGRTTRRRRGRSKELVPHFCGKSRADGIGMLVSLRPEHQAMIERLQPYKRGRGGRACPLSWLKEMNNMDKHQLLMVVGGQAGYFAMSDWADYETPEAGSISRFRILKDGAKIAEVAPHVHVNPNLIPFVAFDKGCPDSIRGKLVCVTLDRIAQEVAEIVEGFAPEFS